MLVDLPFGGDRAQHVDCLMQLFDFNPFIFAVGLLDASWTKNNSRYVPVSKCRRIGAVGKRRSSSIRQHESRPFGKHDRPDQNCDRC